MELALSLDAPNDSPCTTPPQCRHETQETVPTRNFALGEGEAALRKCKITKRSHQVYEK
jgi:hypothetical protein